uniref:Protein involved in the er to golgi transport step of secretion n=1 Tax=Ornithodoros turicata TaxID=34597 RepID=A0A2R5LMW4_9ACAR
MKPNATSRGALRPHYAGRAPPLLLAALLIGLALIGFCYYNLSSQYSALEAQYRDLQDRFRVYAEKREALEAQEEVLKKKLDTTQRELSEQSRLSALRDKEKSAVEVSLRKKDEELMTKTREAEAATNGMTECMQRLNETSTKLTQREGALAKLNEEVNALKEKQVVVKPVQMEQQTPKVEVKQTQRKEDSVRGSTVQEQALDPDVHPKPQDAAQ